MADWNKCVSDMGLWFGANVNTYQKASSNKVKNRQPYPLIYDCPLIGEKIRDDCSGFVSACLIYAGVMGKGSMYNAKDFQSTTGDCADALRAGGFQSMAFDASILQEGDIYAHSGHVEICAGKNMQWGWGNTHYNNMPCKAGYSGSWTNGKTYTTIWRCGGSTNSAGMVYNGQIGFDGIVTGGVVQSIPPNQPRPIMASRGQNTVYSLSSSGSTNQNALSVEQQRRSKFNKKLDDYSNGAPELGRDIVTSQEMFGSEILKGNQNAKTFLKKRKD